MEKNPVILTEEDFGLLRRFAQAEPQKEMSLAYELNRAIIVRKEAFPPKAVRLNSQVSVMDLDSEKVM